MRMEYNYNKITELPGQKASREQLARLYHRYKFASAYCEDKEIIEVACGSGMGLGYIAKSARRVVGADIDEHNLNIAIKYYKGRQGIELKKLDAHQLYFRDNSFDVVVLNEAIYYFRKAIELKPGFVKAYTDMAVALEKQGNIDEAIDIFRHAARLDPQDLSIKHQIAALTEKTTDSAPIQYVRDVFDLQANTFDTHLVEKLQCYPNGY